MSLVESTRLFDSARELLLLGYPLFLGHLKLLLKKLLLHLLLLKLLF